MSATTMMMITTMVWDVFPEVLAEDGVEDGVSGTVDVGDDDNIMMVWETYMKVLPEVLAEDGVEDGVSGAVDVSDDHCEDVHGPVLVEL